MKNNLFNGNLFKVSLLLISITFLLLYACKNNAREFSITDPIAEAKAWYFNSNTNKGTVLQSNKGTSQQITQEVDWNGAKLFKLKDGTDVVSVPVKMILGKVALGGSYMLLIDKIKNKYSLHVAYNSQKDYFKKDVSDGEMITIYNQMLNAKSIPSKSGKGSRLMAITCTEWNLVTTYYDGNSNVIGSTSRYLYTSCSGDLGDYPEPDHGGPVDCAGILAGGAYMSDCGCIGGTTGILECQKVIVKVDVDPDARQCLKDIKAALEVLGMKNTSTSSGLIASVLNKLNLSTGETFNAIITEGSLPNNHLAETIWITNPEYKQELLNQIKFSSDRLNNLTDLAVAATMMHEYVHAYFDSNIRLMNEGKTGYDPNFVESYKLLFDRSGAPLSDQTGVHQHEQMANSFAASIGEMVKKYADLKGIIYPADPDYFKKMGWIGLTSTSAAKYAPAGTSYTLAAERGQEGTTPLSQSLKCKQ